MVKPKDAWKSWGLRFRNQLKDRGKNLAYVAEKMTDKNGDQMSESAVRSWTNGTRKINLEDFFRACEVAELNPAVILFGHPIMSEDEKKRIGALIVSVLEADTSANPDYGDTITKIRNDAKKRNIGREK